MRALNLPVSVTVNDAMDRRLAMLAQTIAGDFMTQGWAVRENFLDGERWRELADESRQLWEKGAFQKAGVGRETTHRAHAGVRGDYTLWLDTQLTPVACRFVARELEAVRSALNAATYMGLFEFEGHFATYPAGTLYERHVDQPHGTQARQVSVVLYLNEAWQASEGGELCLYHPPQPADAGVGILPSGGTLVIFASAQTPHEVRPATRTRCSLSGWLRCRA